ncbi:MAG: hypothetical protein J3K34DRAFT_518615 [Monoraphidium minutum]|nr:MAG: hypothetical protein J3K34DRAFT_518615 [Monoraphidium minutum]
MGATPLSAHLWDGPDSPEPPTPCSMPQHTADAELEACGLQQLQAALDAAGARSRLPPPSAGAPAALGAAVAAAHELLGMLRRSDELRRRQEEAAARARCEARLADRAAQALRGQSEAKDQEAAGLKIKLRQLDAWYRSEVDRWTAEREELSRRNAGLEARHVQFAHELRRRDGAYEKLQAKLLSRLRAPSEMRQGPPGDVDAPAGPEGAAGAAPRRSAPGHSRRGSDVSSGGGGGGGSAGSSASGTPRGAAAAVTGARARRGSTGGADAPGGPAARAAAAQRRSSGGGPPPAAPLTPAAAPAVAPSAPAGAGAAAAWQEVRAKLAALQVRAQRVKVLDGSAGSSLDGSDGSGGGGGDFGGELGGGGGAAAQLGLLARQASTPQERLLVAKLMEASQIMSEQEQTLKVAIAALAPAAAHGGGRPHAGDGGGA